jgi:RNA polymerase sigma factor (sigma-70 family)
MASEHTAVLLRHLRHLVTAGDDPASDAVLLARFIDRRDRDALAALVTRHGPMVQRVARTVLGNTPEADDVFQATFLVLTRKAAALKRRAALAGWLYGVAYRLSLQARTAAARRQAHEKQVVVRAPADPLDELTLREAQAILAEELHRLPERYRAPLLLCYWEGTTQDDAARRLGWSLSTLKRWLERAREMMGRRLERRGLTMGAVLAGGLVVQGATSAAIAARLSERTAQTALLCLMGGAAASESQTAVALAESMLRPWLAGKLAWSTTLILLLSVAAVCVELGLRVNSEHHLDAEGQNAEPFAPPKQNAEKQISRVDAFGDPLPDEALARLGTTRLRHGALVYSVVFAPDGKTLATADASGFVYVWESDTGKQRWQYDLSSAPGQVGWDAAGTLVYSPDGKMLAAARANRPPCIFDVANGGILHELGGTGRANWVAFSPDGKQLAYNAFSNPSDDRPAMCLADATTGAELSRVVIEQPGILRLFFSFQCKTIVSTSTDGTIRLRDEITGIERRRFNGDVHGFSPDGTRLAYVGNDKAIHLIYGASGNEAQVLKNVSTSLNYLELSPDGSAVAGFSHPDGVLALWDLTTGKAILTQKYAGERETVRTLTFSYDGATLVSGHEDGTVRTWDSKTGKPRCQLNAHDERVGRLALSRDGNILATAGHSNTTGDQTVRLWNPNTGKTILDDRSPRHGVSFLAISPNGRLVATSSYEPALHVWDARSGKLLHETIAGGPIVFASDSNTLISGGWSDGKLRYWDAGAGRELRQMKAHEHGIHCLALAPDGRTLVTAGHDRLIRLWDCATGVPIRSFGAETGIVLRLAFSSDGKTLACAHAGNVVRLWDVATGTVVRQIDATKSQTKQPGALCFSPNATLLAWSDGEDSIHLTNATTGEEIRRVQADKRRTDPLDAIAFSPDGKSLIWSGQHWKQVFVFEVATGQLRHQFQGHHGHIIALAYTSAGDRIASGSSDASVLLWDAVGRLQRAQDPRPVLTASEKTSFWTDLASDRSVVAYVAVQSLAERPREAISLIGQRLRPVPAPDGKRLSALIRDLDNDEFNTRERARNELEKAGDCAASAIRKKLDSHPSAEARRHLTDLLDICAPKDWARSPELLRILRATEVLERIGTADAKQLLQTLAAGAPDARLTREAKASLERLAQHPTP